MGKILAIICMALMILSLGLYLVLNNLGFMLTEEHAGLRLQPVSSGVEIKTGDWTQRIDLRIPKQIQLSRGKWRFQSGNRIITLEAMPVIKIKWM